MKEPSIFTTPEDGLDMPIGGEVGFGMTRELFDQQPIGFLQMTGGSEDHPKDSQCRGLGDEQTAHRVTQISVRRVEEFISVDERHCIDFLAVKLPTMTISLQLGPSGSAIPAIGRDGRVDASEAI